MLQPRTSITAQGLSQDFSLHDFLILRLFSGVDFPLPVLEQLGKVEENIQTEWTVGVAGLPIFSPTGGRFSQEHSASVHWVQKQGDQGQGSLFFLFEDSCRELSCASGLAKDSEAQRD